MRRFLAGSLALIALVACAKAKPPVASSPSPKGGGDLVGPPPAKVAAVLNFKADKLGGGQVVGSEFAGKDVVVWFWAPW